MLLAMTGTFDVENYGDVLFPLLAKHELGKRIHDLDIHLFSCNVRSTPAWPYPVLPLTELPPRVNDYDGIIVGGGDVVRFDKDVATGYRPTADWIHHPTGYWLAPSLLALQHGIPLIWNAPGCVTEIPVWAKFLVRMIVQEGAYISVRDRYSLQRLLGGALDPKVRIVPDSAFGVGQLVSSTVPTDDYTSVCARFGIRKPYVVIQAAAGDVAHLKDLAKDNHGGLGRYQPVILPIGPAVGDDVNIAASGISDVVTLPFFRNPLLLAEVIANAEAVVGHSLHMSITALTSGVPVFSSANLWNGKHSMLLDTAHVYPFPIEGRVYAPWFLKRVGRFAESPGIAERRAGVAAHWDSIARVLQSGRGKPSTGMDRFWFTLPATLEEIFASHKDRDPGPPLVQNESTAMSAMGSALAKLTPRRVARAVLRRIKQWVRT